MEQDRPPEQPWGLLASPVYSVTSRPMRIPVSKKKTQKYMEDSARPRRKVHSGPSCSRQGTPAPGEGIPARMEQDQSPELPWGNLPRRGTCGHQGKAPKLS